eukprot:COSAG02_NODE_2238_length_9414_cov_5.054321_4_plen_175_part_00
MGGVREASDRGFNGHAAAERIVAVQSVRAESIRCRHLAAVRQVRELTQRQSSVLNLPLNSPVCLRPYAHSSRDASTAYIKQAPGRLVQKRQAEPASESAFAPPKESYSLRATEAPATSKVVPVATSVSPVCMPKACLTCLTDRNYDRASCPTYLDGARTRMPHSTALQVWRFRI